jgi:hypothetical protein
VWYDDGATGEFDLPIGGTVVSADAGQIVIKTDDNEVRGSCQPSYKAAICMLMQALPFRKSGFPLTKQINS